MHPHDLPPWGAVHQQARRWVTADAFEHMADDLRAIPRVAGRQTPDPSAAIRAGLSGPPRRAGPRPGTTGTSGGTGSR
jgi:hypothetical protein